MASITKVSSKGDTTIPGEILAALALSPGDFIEWHVPGQGRAEVRRMQPQEGEWLHALHGTLSEWESEEDECAFGDL